MIKRSQQRGACVVVALVLACPSLGGWAPSVARAEALGWLDPEDDVTIILDADAGANKRTKAVDRLWEAAEAGRYDRAAARETLKTVIWKSSAPSPLRQAVLAKLLSDASPGAIADTRKLLRLRMPTESQWPVIDDICRAITARAGDQAWREMTGALVRSYARRVPTPPDADRPERGALLALYPGESIEQIAFKVYLKPAGEINGGELSGQAPELVEKQRDAAWELLGRLDPNGGVRASMMAAAPQDDPALRPIARCAQELKVVPVTGSELSWAKRLIEGADAGGEGAAWWSESSAAVGKLNGDQLKGLQLRHIEPVRWAAKHKPDWLATDRDTLLSELERRLDGRRVWRKTADMGDSGRLSKESLKDWRDALVWGDALAILVIDDALRSAGVASELFAQAAADRADSSTEYGGGLWAAEPVPGGSTNPKWTVKDNSFVVKGFNPRPGQRVNDRTFVAPEALFTADGAGGRVLCHYHFHVQTDNNADYAGPGVGDMEYAATHGRACLVLTSVKKGVLNADYYQRNGVTIDLGELKESR
ncbi:MAG: hypothetical protein IT438_15765 [Phycisphaerales bacterium]|nr:hypothetical protein [Phycisphaerales bacterium]